MDRSSHKWWAAGSSGDSGHGGGPRGSSGASGPRPTAAGPDSEERIQVAGVLAAGLAHEVNNTLTAMFAHLSVLARQLFVELKDDQPASPKALDDARRHLIGAQEAADHMAGVVGDVVSFVRAAPPPTGAIEVRRAIERALSLAQYCSKGDVELRRRLDDVTPVVGSATALTQIALNLILNAIAAFEGTGRRDGHVVVSLSQHGQLVALEIQDDGPGLNAEVAERLFRPLATGRSHGVGLGLAITLQLVHAMHGEIEVGSPPSGGTRFRVLLPAATP